jgi:hypothetical protein
VDPSVEPVELVLRLEDLWDRRFRDLEAALTESRGHAETVSSLEESIRRLGESLAQGRKKVDSPYFTKEEAAEYLRPPWTASTGGSSGGRLTGAPALKNICSLRRCWTTA